MSGRFHYGSRTPQGPVAVVRVGVNRNETWDHGKKVALHRAVVSKPVSVEIANRFGAKGNGEPRMWKDDR